MNQMSFIKALFKFVVTIIIVLTGCAPSREKSSLPSTQVVDKDRKLVEYIVFDIVDPRMKSFISRVRSLNSQVSKACDTDEAAVRNLRESWVRAMMDFHYLETLAFGPLGAKDGAVKRGIYSLSVMGQGTLIDREIQKAFRLGSDYKQVRIRNYLVGLDAIEYILFEYFSETDVINREIPACGYLVFITEHLRSRVESLTKAWGKQELEFIRSPEGQTRMRKTMGRITDSLVMFADKEMKDRKVGASMGKKSPCPENNCAELYMEHPFSGMAKEAFIENLKALSDLIRLYSELKKLTDWLKKDFPVYLNTDLPGSVQGDND